LSFPPSFGGHFVVPLLIAPLQPLRGKSPSLPAVFLFLIPSRLPLRDRVLRDFFFSIPSYVQVPASGPLVGTCFFGSPLVSSAGKRSPVTCVLKPFFTRGGKVFFFLISLPLTLPGVPLDSVCGLPAPTTPIHLSAGQPCLEACVDAFFFRLGSAPTFHSSWHWPPPPRLPVIVKLHECWVIACPTNLLPTSLSRVFPVDQPPVFSLT